MQVEFSEEGRLDVIEAQQWYGERVSGLGTEFGRAVDVAVAGIVRFPRAYPKVHREFRKAVLRRFPYSLLFVVESGLVVILACFHQRRDPTIWPEGP